MNKYEISYKHIEVYKCVVEANSEEEATLKAHEEIEEVQNIYERGVAEHDFIFSDDTLEFPRLIESKVDPKGVSNE